ncbi:growth hormone secretagogue receptor type 1-like [Mercenaria mercenaria]|uniref:growth hormone secretagogue receptor type 1-like n=1 Tax=Mercenaria mercenaria TaxID=6596 RepID=UPI00234F4574|nr:growth hormone secretagogue receptor type 1-like [Mercenaria mercenaria]
MFNNTTSLDTSSDTPQLFNNDCVLPENWTTAPFAYGEVDSLLDTISLPILFVFGIFGNTFTVVILFRQKGHWHTLERFLTALAFSDTVLLIFDVLVVWLGYIRETELFDDSEIICKLHLYLSQTCYQFSAWILVALTIERLLSVVVPHKLRDIVTTKRVNIYITILVILAFGINSHLIFGTGHDEGESNKCWYESDSYESFYNIAWTWIELFIEFAIPFVIILFSNVILLYKLSKRQKILSQTKGLNTGRNQRLTLMVVMLCIVFCVSMSPYVLCKLFWESWADNLHQLWCVDKEEYDEKVDQYTWIVAITNAVSYINPSINFILYVISGSRFRGELKALFLCKQAGNKNVFS